MKKIIALTLVLCMCFSMIGCSAITTTHAAENEKVAEEEAKDLGDLLTEVAAGMLASWLTSEIENYISQQENNANQDTEAPHQSMVPNDDVVPLEK